MNERAVLISIQPKWIEKIARGEKTIEVRKSRPKLETPFMCYIYMTATKRSGLLWEYDTAYQNSKGDIVDGGKKVIGEFVCDRIDRYYYTELIGRNSYDEGYAIGEGNPCLSYEEFMNYGKGNDLYGWHISQLKIYDKPKELSEFYLTKPKPMNKWTDNDYCQQCKYHKWIGSMKDFAENGKPMREKCTLGKPEPICEYTPPITRPPQSWCYVEQLKENADD